ncbi:hypothetical protein Hs30E_20570 [Lactococcus hodotermopsidis]|uniref:Uncharacterized protein n=1 Tax=Pseudolactococcus hodotermopsidis TaxID=2709157 RepID=A0A6A0BDN4_9LACT|nr:hypothetical protein [Lactococcus hodotermopsidis]GFH43510.1 hypothetical protein Hs30E_20570 [Lactococcus hodotermopsidis]
MSNFKEYEIDRLSLAGLCKLLINHAIEDNFRAQDKALNHIIDIIYSDFSVGESENIECKVVSEIPSYDKGTRALNEVLNEKSEIKSNIKSALTDKESDCKRISEVLQGKREIKHLGKKINYMDYFHYERVCAFCFVLLDFSRN